MSPAQARGEVLTPASDMFSFGLLLQVLFTGNDPHPMGLSAREVILRVARGETNSVESAPGDVTALINRMKQFAPADRPTAVEAVERIQLLIDKPRRIARRAAVAALVIVASIAAWRYTADLKRERAIAVSAHEEAVQRRAQAEDLMEFMLGDLRKKLEPVGRLDVLNDVAQRALAYSASLDPAKLSVDELLRNAKGLHQLVQVRIAQGNLDGALQAATRAGALTDAAAKRNPQSADVQLGVATSHFWIANVHRHRAELPQALKHAERYQVVTAKLATDHPTDRDYQLERDYGEEAVATILELQGDLPRASAVYARSIQVRRARVAANPSSITDREELALYLNKLGFVRQRLGELISARRNFEEELATYEALAAADPSERKWRERLVNSHSYLGGLLDVIGDGEASLTHRKTEIALGRELHRYDPGNANWHRNLAIAEMRMGDLLRRRADGAGALRLIDDAEALLDELVSRESARKSWRRDLAVVRIARARVLLATGRSAEAVGVSRRASDELSSLAFADPLSRRHEAEAAMTFGEALAHRGDAAGAQTQWQRASQILEPLARSSKDPLVLDIWARALLRLGHGTDADAVLNRIDQTGYRNSDLELLRKRRSA
jgi:tetratricopeptide (TPR) repeat protein